MLKSQEVYDVVIVGGGMSGLRAAYELSNFNMLLLEKNERLGGRVYTRSFEDINYDLGAAFAFEPDLVPFEFEAPKLIEEPQPIAVFVNDSLHKGDNPFECLLSLRLNEKRIIALNNYSSKTGFDFSDFQEWEMRIINSFFHLVAAGDIRDYNAKRQLDAFVKWSTNHYETGNQVLIDAYEKQIEGDYILGCEVISVSDLGTHKKVVYKQNNKQKTVLAKSVVLAAQAKTSLDLIPNPAPLVKTILSEMKFFPYAVVAISLKNDNDSEESLLITPQSIFSNVVVHKTVRKNTNVYLFNFAGVELEKTKDWLESDYVAYCKKELEKIRKNKISSDNILFTDFAYWHNAAVEVGPKYYSKWEDILFQPQEGFFLAGDYLDIYGFPNGMKAAVRSGQFSAKMVREFLQEKP